MKFLTKVKVMKTIWPYPEGWGVVIKRPFKVDTVVDVGLSKEEAEERAEQIRKEKSKC